MRARLLYGSLSLLVVLGVFLLDARLNRPVGFTALAAATTWLGAREYFAIAAPGAGAAPALLVAAAGIVLHLGLALGMDPDRWMEFALIGFFGVIGLRNLLREDHRAAFQDLIVGTFGFVYVALFPAYLLRVRLMQVQGFEGFGFRAALLVLLTAKACDVGAYYTGRTFGRRRMLPAVSPKKSWEGALGGTCLSVLVAAILAGPVLGLPGFGLWTSAALGVLLAAAGQLGDLIESQMKRAAGVKDSSDWLPGLGGILDLLDSLLFAAPVGYLFIQCVLQRG
jgi:phosphatidate cytidylyltransferase